MADFALTPLAIMHHWQHDDYSRTRKRKEKKKKNHRKQSI